MLGSLTGVAAFVVADVARAEAAAQAPATSDALPEGSPAVVTKVKVKARPRPSEETLLLQVLGEAKLGRFEGY